MGVMGNGLGHSGFELIKVRPVSLAELSLSLLSFRANLLCAPMPVKSFQFAWFKKTLRALARWLFKLFSNKQHIRAFTHIYLAN